MDNPNVISGIMIVNFVRTLFFCNMPALLAGFHQFCVKSMLLLFTQIHFISQVESPKGARSHEKRVAVSTLKDDCCRSCKRLLPPAGHKPDEGAREALRGGLSAAEIDLVAERLGMKLEEDGETERDGRCRDCFLVEAVEGVVERKEASVEELEAAFSVFDTDGDGYIGPEELREVMWRLGMEEGGGLERCRRMIGAFDEDGDGRIDLAEFRNLLESAT